MRTIISIFLIISFHSVWGQEQPKPKVNPEIKRFVYQKNTSIQKRVYDSIYFDVEYVEKSNNWVFKYSLRGEENEMIADDEYFESYEFEMPAPKGNSFVINSRDFEKYKVLYNRSCFCPDAGPRQLKEGKISGKKVSANTWLVTFELTIVARPGAKSAPYKKTFKGYFKPGKLIYE